MPYMQMDKKLLNKGTIALGLLIISALFYGGYWLYTGDLAYISNYFYIHLAFLPIHALVLGLILDELIQMREKIERRKRLNMFLGIFFRQMGLDFMLNMLLLVDNREELEERLLVDKGWKGHHFRRARRDLAHLHLVMRPDRAKLADLLDLLASREEDIIEMTRNPLMLEFESLYRCLLALFHLIEETHFRGPVEGLSDGAVNHLASDAGKALTRLSSLWLAYLEHLKGEHPVLFGFQVGLHNTIQPVMLGEETRDSNH